MSTAQHLTYPEYLTARLCNLYFWFDLKFTYDEEFEEAKDIYSRFRKSDYNNKNKGLYECLEGFIKDMNEKFRSNFTQEMYLELSGLEKNNLSYNELRYKLAKEILSK